MISIRTELAFGYNPFYSLFGRRCHKLVIVNPTLSSHLRLIPLNALGIGLALSTFAIGWASLNGMLAALILVGSTVARQLLMKTETIFQHEIIGFEVSRPVEIFDHIFYFIFSSVCIATIPRNVAGDYYFAVIALSFFAALFALMPPLNLLVTRICGLGQIKSSSEHH